MLCVTCTQLSSFKLLVRTRQTSTVFKFQTILMKKKCPIFSAPITIRLFVFLITLMNGAEILAQTAPTINPNPSEQSIPEETPPPSLENVVNQLNGATLKQKIDLVKQIIQFKEDSRTKLILISMLNAKLYYAKAEPKPVYALKKSSTGILVTNVLTEEKFDQIKKSSLKKIGVNNRLRKLLKSGIAQINLSSEDMKTRLKAVKAISQQITPNSILLLETQKQQESDKNILALIETALATDNLQSKDQQTRLQAIATLSESLEIRHNLAIKNLLQKDSDGNYLENNPKIVDAANKAVTKIESRIGFYENLQTLFFGISLGSVLVLAAIGLAITFGVMGVINMAHGELIMLGAYTTYVIQLMMPEHIDISLFLAIPAAFIVSGLFGILIERGVIRFLYGRPLETLLATFGISLILQQLVRTIFSPLNRSVSTPSWMSGSIELNSVLSLTLNRLYIIAFTILVFFILLAILKKTRLGLEVRAVSQNRAMAKAMGIKTEWVDALTFGLGSGVAGVAGVALSQLTNVGPNLGQAYIIDSFMVVVFGGVGNLWGTLISGLSLGIANKYLEPYAGAVLAKILVLVFIIVFIQKRPRGLFPQKGRAAEN